MTMLLDRGASSNDVRERQFARYNGRYLELNRRIRWAEGHTEEELAGDPEVELPPPNEASTYLVDTVLSLAMTRGHRTIIQRLIDEGADVHVRFTAPTVNESLEMLLHIAARYLNAAAIELLYEHCGDAKFREMIRYRYSFQRTSLHLAAMGPCFVLPIEQIVPRAVATVSFLLHYCTTELADAKDCQNHTALQKAMFFDFGVAHKTIQEASSDGNESLMEKPNKSGKKSREIQEESRKMLRDDLKPCIRIRGGRTFVFAP